MSQAAVSPEEASPTWPPPPPPPPPPDTGTASRRWIREAAEVAGIALVLYLVIWSVLQTVRVEGDSMIPTLRTHDLLLASKISYHLHDPERGDIVILNPPQPARSPGVPEPPERDFIKRVVGVSNDVLQVDSNQHPAVIQIKPGGRGPWHTLAEPYLGERWEQPTPCCDSGGRASVGSTTPLTIPRDMYFVMGDNRNRSSDSRFFGLVPKDRISAKAFVRIWPLDSLGTFGAGPALLPAVAIALPLAVTRAGRRIRRRSPSAGPPS
ncbi:MAG: signal peptidase I [Candidatus Dormibacteria bacterium]